LRVGGYIHLLLLNKLFFSPVSRNTIFPFNFFGANDETELSNFALLPGDVVRILLSSLLAQDLSRLNCVSRYFMVLTNDNSLWQNLTEKQKFRYGYKMLIDHAKTTHWKHLYIREYRYINRYNFVKTKEPAGVMERLYRGVTNIFNTGIFAPRFLEGKWLLLGMDAAGKTTILYKLNLGELENSTCVIGFNVEEVLLKTGCITSWDVGGPDKIRPLWRHYYQSACALIFVVDSNDRERINEAALELQKILREDELQNTILLVFANKQDLPNAMSVAEVTEKMELHSLRSRNWYIQATCAVTGEGLYEGFEWLQHALQK